MDNGAWASVHGDYNRYTDERLADEAAMEVFAGNSLLDPYKHIVRCKEAKIKELLAVEGVRGAYWSDTFQLFWVAVKVGYDERAVIEAARRL